MSLDAIKDSLGWKEKLAVYVLWRWFKNGGFVKMLDFFPGKKEQALNILGMIGGAGGIAMTLAAWLGGGPDAKLNLEALAAAYAAMHYSAQQFAKRLAQDRSTKEVKVATVAAVALSQQDATLNPTTAPLTVHELTAAVNREVVKAEVNMTPATKENL